MSCGCSYSSASIGGARDYNKKKAGKKIKAREIKLDCNIAQVKVRFRARWLVSIAVLCLFSMLLSLGFWQLARLEWKNNLLAQIEARAELKAVDYLSEKSRFGANDAFTRVRLVGILDFANEQFLLRRHVDGRPGWHVLTPLLLGEGAGVLFVNRGWLSFEQQEMEVGSDKIYQGINERINEEEEVALEGLLHFPGKAPRWLMPDDQPEKKLWYREDLPAMASSLANAVPKYSNGVSKIETRWLVIAAKNSEQSNNDELPEGGQWVKSIRNAHASYAATWFLLSLSLLVVFFVANTELSQEKASGKSKVGKSKVGKSKTRL